MYVISNTDKHRLVNMYWGKAICWPQSTVIFICGARLNCFRGNIIFNVEIILNATGW